MIKSLKNFRLGAFLATALILGGIALAPPSNAEAPARKGTYQTTKSPIVPVVDKLKAAVKGPRRDCDGKTTTACCEGLSYCGCLYMPGKSDDTHPTACFSNPPPKPKG